MHNVKNSTIKKTYNPFDVVTNSRGDVGYICEVSINNCQPEAKHQISYAVNWLVGTETKHAWWEHDELTSHCNMLVEIAKGACHPSGHGQYNVPLLFNNWNGGGE